MTTIAAEPSSAPSASVGPRVTEFVPAGAPRRHEGLAPVIARLTEQRHRLGTTPVADYLALFNDFSQRILRDPETARIDGIAFLSSWLRSSNLQRVLELNTGGQVDRLDGFRPVSHASPAAGLIAAKPRGLVAMWMAGNVPTLPMFSIVPALLAKNVCLVKLAEGDSAGAQALLRVLAASTSPNLSGSDLLKGVAVVFFDRSHKDINDAMSMAADAKVMWGGEAAVKAITTLPRREHCVEIVFGPKYSIGVIGRSKVADDARLDDAVAGFVRDISSFDQRACSSPQTIFVERAGSDTLRRVGERFAAHFAKLPPKPPADAYTCTRIANCRAEWALDPERDLIASGLEPDWTVCMDRAVEMKEAVQSRTIFLVEVASWRDVLERLSPRIQTVGIAFDDEGEAKAFGEEATLRGAVRCVRPGLMNLHESPWDGRLLVSDLVRWVTLKP